MTKDDLVRKVYDELKASKRESAGLVDSVFELLRQTLESGENIKISGFGHFQVKKKNDRRGRNPQTGEDITITARRVLSFKPSDKLKKRLNG